MDVRGVAHIVQLSLFPELRKPQSFMEMKGWGGLNQVPCTTCPLNKNVRVPPLLPKTAKVLAIGIAPGKEEEKAGTPFVGESGQIIRRELRRNGIDPERDVAWANTLRCRPPNDDFQSDATKFAIKRCWMYLRRDINVGGLPLLLIGQQPVERFLNASGRRASVMKERGLWQWNSMEDRLVFAVRHPAAILRSESFDDANALATQFAKDIARCAAYLHSGDGQGDSSIITEVFESPGHAKDWIEAFARSPRPFAFDIETYDVQECPARKGVAVDTCHPDFRVRGVAIATGPKEGVWIELRSWEDRKKEARELLNKIFLAPVPSLCQNGGFDHEGLVYSRWVDGVANRAGDTMLALIALGDTIKPESYALQWAIVNVLGENQHWVGVKKSEMRDLPLSVVAHGAVHDAVMTYRLATVLHKRLAKGEYF